MKLLVNRAMKRVLALFLTVVAVLGLFGMQTPISKVSAAGETKTYEKVTVAPTDWSGEYLIVYEGDEKGDGKVALNGNLTTLDAGENGVSIEIVDNKIQASNEYAFTIVKIEGSTTYSIKSYSNYYIGNNTTSNKLVSNQTTAYKNAISLDENGNVQIEDEKAARYLRYNSATGDSNLRFRYYKSTSQQPICLYKLVNENQTDCEHTDTKETITPAKCTEDGAKVVVCNDCGKTIDNIPILATGHDYVDGACSVCGEKEPQEITYKLVTDVADLMVGDKIIVVGKNTTENKTYALNKTQNTNNRGQVEITVDSNTVKAMENDENIEQIEIEAGSVAGTFAFKTDEGYLYAASSDKNYLKSQNTLSDNGSWNVEIAESGVATVKAQGDETHNWLRYNQSSDVFACYASGQQDIYIYRMQYSAEVEGDRPVDELKAFMGDMTEASLKLTYTEGGALDTNEVRIRFRAEIDKTCYDKLIAAGTTVKFGIEATNGSEKKFGGECVPVEVAGKYVFAGLFKVSEASWNTEITAKAFVEIDGVKYYMQETVSSVKVLADFHLANGYADNAVIQQLAGQA